MPAKLVDAPGAAVDCLASRLDVPARAIFDYAVRERTGRDHLALVRDRLGFRIATEREIDRLRTWLVEQALERDKPTLLLQRACDELRGWRVERPSLDRLVRLIAWAREHAHERIYELLSPVLIPQLRHALDQLLVVGRAAGPHAAVVASLAADVAQSAGVATGAGQAGVSHRADRCGASGPRGADTEPASMAGTARAPAPASSPGWTSSAAPCHRNRTGGNLEVQWPNPTLS